MRRLHVAADKMNRRTCLQAVAGTAVGLMVGGQWAHGNAEVFAAAPPSEGKPPLDPLTLKQSLELAGQHLLGILNPDDNYLPYWSLNVTPDYKAEFGRWWPAHNLGRWLDAMLRLEEEIGFEIPKPIEAAMIENVRRFFDNPDHICLNPGPRNLPSGAEKVNVEWDLHSLREGLLALNALARWRKNDWAASMGKQMIQSLDAKLRDDGSWNLDKFDACQKRGKGVIHNTDPCDTHGRLLEALIWFYETTGDLDALKLAKRIAEYHFANTTQPDGAINPAAKADHTHSYLGTLRGLLLYGRLTHQHQYTERVAAAYRVNVPRHITESGYTSHNMVQESMGETTSPGDAAQLALWLYEEGYSEMLDDAERLVRARILPSQIRETPLLQPTADDGKDWHKDLSQRIMGGFGGCHDHPHGGKKAVTDVTCADVHTLVDIYKHVAVSENSTLEVLFHFDYEDDRVRIRNRRGVSAELSVTPKTEAGVSLRVPTWAPRDAIRVRCGEKIVQPVFMGNFVWLGKVPANTQITMNYPLPERRSKEKGLGIDTEILWRGDEVVGIRPNTTFYPFYPTAPQ